MLLGAVKAGSMRSLTPDVAEQHFGVEQVERREVGKQRGGAGRRGVQPVGQGNLPVVGGEVGLDLPVEFGDEGNAIASREVRDALKIRFLRRLGRAGVAAGGLGHEEPAGNRWAQGLEVQAEVAPADQPHRVGEDDRAFGGDHVPAAEPGHGQTLEIFVPVLQVQHGVLNGGQPKKLLRSALGADLPSFQVLPSEQAVHKLKPGAAKRDRHANPKHLIGARLHERVAGARTGHGRVDRSPAECLQLTSALLPMHGHQGQDEVGLIELHALGVDPDEDLRDLLLVGGGTEFYDLKTEIAQITDPVDAFLQLVLLSIVQVPAPRLGQSV